MPEYDTILGELGREVVIGVNNTNYTILSSVQTTVIFVFSLSTDRYVYLPAASDVESGRSYIILNYSVGTYDLIITPDGADTINDVASLTIGNSITNDWSKVIRVSGAGWLGIQK